MKAFCLGILLLLAGLPLMTSGGSVFAAADHAGHPLFLNNEQLQWGPPPPGLPAGAKAAVLYGDPHKPGPFVVRLSVPKGYVIRPHWHTKAENLTVLSGALHLGMADTFDREKAQTLKVGGYHFLPAKAHHFAFMDEPTVVQVHGEGPFDINYINPADDPRHAARK